MIALREYAIGDLKIYYCDGFGLLIKPQAITHLNEDQIKQLAQWCDAHEQEARAVPTMEHIAEFSHSMLWQVADWILESTANGDLGPQAVRDLAKKEVERRKYNLPIEYLPRDPSPPKRKQKRPGFIYLAYSETDHYKIGKSVGPEDRIAVFDTQMPVEVSMVHTFEADDMSTAEAELHNTFLQKIVKGEWFDLDIEDVNWIKAINSYEAGVFHLME